MATMKMPSVGVDGGGTLNPIIPTDGYIAVVRTGNMRRFTIDPTKKYILNLGLRYNDSPYRTRTYYYTDGTLTEFNSHGSVAMEAILENSTTILVRATQDSSTYYCDLTLIQLN